MKVHLQQLKNFILVFDVSLSRWVIVLKAGAPLRLLINFSWKSAKYKKASPPIDVLSLLKGRLFRIAAFLCTCLHSHTQPCRRINSQPFFLMTQLFYCTDYPLSFLVVRKIAQESRSLWLECRAMINPRNDPKDTRWRSVCCIISNVKWANGPRWTKWVATVASLEDIV